MTEDDLETTEGEDIDVTVLGMHLGLTGWTVVEDKEKEEELIIVVHNE